MTEAEYRALPIDSYSTIKVFLDDRKKYYRKFILKDLTEEEEQTPYTKFGSLFDCLRLTPNEFEDKFALALTQVPTGQYLKLVEQLMKVTIASLNEHGEVTREVEDMLLDAYNQVKYDRNQNIVDFKRDSFEAAKAKFMNSELHMYYRQLRDSYGKIVIEPSDVEKAQAIVNELNSNEFTRDIMTISNSDEKYKVHRQLPIIGKFEVDGMDFPLKCLLDMLVIDYVNKTITIYDLKTVWDNEREFTQNYFKYKYYIQMAVYFYLVVQWKKTQEELKDFGVYYPRFIAVDSNNYKSPLIYTTNSANFDQGMNGFFIRGKYYPGVTKAITDMIWHKETGIWNISKDNYESKGIVRVQPFQ
jgi:hypothetical protein